MKVNKIYHLNTMIRAYTLYEIILNRIETNTFYKISDEIIKHDLQINM
jgi:hypothetical protein